MRAAALSIAVLLGIASLGAAEARATPTVSASIVIESGQTVQIGGKRHHHRFHRGPAPKRHEGLARHYKRHDPGRHHRPAFVAKRVQGPVVIVKPAHGRLFAHRHLPARPLIRNRSFARSPHHWSRSPHHWSPHHWSQSPRHW